MFTHSTFVCTECDLISIVGSILGVNYRFLHAVYPLEKTLFLDSKNVPIAINFAVERLASLWRANDKEVMTLTIPEDCEGFKSYYDALQEKIS